jgi:tryptophan synthase alpha subunit
MSIPWGCIGYPTFKRTYARKLRDEENSPTEEFEQTVERVLSACDKQLKVGFTVEEREDARQVLKEIGEE